MANTIISPNMNLPVPVVSVDPGPDWATNIDACLSAIDSHDHSPGKGVPVTPAGINITSDLTLNSNSLLAAFAAVLVNQAAPLTAPKFYGAIYEVLGDLWYTNSSGAAIQLTAGSFSNVSVLACTNTVNVTGSVALTDKALHFVDTASGPISLTLPSPANTRYITIKDTTGNALTNPMTLVRFGTEKIENVAANFAMNYSYGSWSITSNGTDWFIT